MLDLKRVLVSMLLGHEPGHETFTGSGGIQMERGIHIKMHTNSAQRGCLHVKIYKIVPREAGFIYKCIHFLFFFCFFVFFVF